MQAQLADPWIQAQIDAAVAPYSGRLPPEEIAWMREQLADALATEKLGQDLVRRARPRVVERSGEVACGPVDDSESTPAAPHDVRQSLPHDVRQSLPRDVRQFPRRGRTG